MGLHFLTAPLFTTYSHHPIPIVFIKILFIIYFFGCTASGILVPQPEIELASPAVEVQSLNYWTAREAPKFFFTNEGSYSPLTVFISHFIQGLA